MRQTFGGTRLRDKTLALVRAVPRSVTLQQIADEAGLPAAWLSAFARGEIDNPSVCRIERLWEYLTGRQLEVD